MAPGKGQMTCSTDGMNGLTIWNPEQIAPAFLGTLGPGRGIGEG